MTDRSHLRQVTGWLSDLANLTAGNAPLADAKPKIAALASMLAEDYPRAAFCHRSLAAVAGGCRFFPCYSEICALLGAWWRDNRPAPVAIAPAAASEPSRQAAFDSWAGSTEASVRLKVASVETVPSAMVKRALGELLAAAVSAHAPHCLSVVPAEWVIAAQKSAHP